jgi:diguanylate cyclase
VRIQRLRTRIIVFFVALLALVQVAALGFVNAANSRNAQAKVAEELNVGERVFARLLTQNAEKLGQAARVLAADFPFREAIATHDVRTLASALSNHGARIGADAMLFIDLDGRVVADTLRPDQASRRFEYPALIAPNDAGSANAGMHIIDGRALQLVSVPVLAPLPIGSVVVGFAVDDALARDLRQLTSLEVSFFIRQSNDWQVLASTLDAAGQSDLHLGMTDGTRKSTMRVISVGGVEHQARVIQIGDGSDTRIVAVLHRSLADALAVFDRLRTTLVVLAALSLLFSIIGSIVTKSAYSPPA